jgi:hypothetical protein
MIVGDWKVIYSELSHGGGALETITLSFYRAPRTYTVENVKTRQRRKVFASSDDELRRKIVAGEFSKD